VLILTGLLQLGHSGRGVPQIDQDSQERISIFLQVLSEPSEDFRQLCLVDCRDAFSAMLSERLAAEAADEPKAVPSQARPRTR